MGKTVSNPKRHIISCRIEEGEYEVLQQIAEDVGINISSLLRQGVEKLLLEEQRLSA